MKDHVTLCMHMQVLQSEHAGKVILYFLGLQ